MYAVLPHRSPCPYAPRRLRSPARPLRLLAAAEHRQGRGPGGGLPGRADAGRGGRRRRQPVRGDAVRRRRQEGRACSRSWAPCCRMAPPEGTVRAELQAAARRASRAAGQGRGGIRQSAAAAEQSMGRRPSPARSISVSLAGACRCQRRADLPHRRPRRSGRRGPAAWRRQARAQHPALALQDCFRDRLYVELHTTWARAEEEAIEPALLDLAYARDLPLVATNDVHFLDADGYEALDALLCIAEGAQMAQEERRRLTRRAPLQDCGRDGRPVRRPARGHRQHAGRRPALRLHGTGARANPALLRRGRGSGDAPPGRRGPRAPARADGVASRDGRVGADRGSAALPRAAGVRARRHRPDEVSRAIS